MELPAQIGYCTQREISGWVVIELPEKVLRGTDECLFRQQIDELSRNHLKLAIDMHNTRFVDSSIVTLLLSTEKVLSSKGGMLAILSPKPQALDLFEVTSIDKIMKVISNESDLGKL